MSDDPLVVAAFRGRHMCPGGCGEAIEDGLTHRPEYCERAKASRTALTSERYWVSSESGSTWLFCRTCSWPDDLFVIDLWHGEVELGTVLSACEAHDVALHRGHHAMHNSSPLF